MDKQYQKAEIAYNKKHSPHNTAVIILEQVRMYGVFNAPRKPNPKIKDRVKSYNDYRDKILSLIDAVEGYSEEKKIIAGAFKG